MKNCSFSCSGKDNTIEFGLMARFSNCKFVVQGNGCKIKIGGRHTIVSDTTFWCQHDGSAIVIGDDFMMGGGHIAAIEGKSVIIGDDCMFSEDIEVRNGDSHGIYSVETDRRINPSEDVVLYDHVWVGAHSRILKGASIPPHSIIGNSAVVSGKFSDAHSVYAGVPAKKVKSGTDWHKYMEETLTEAKRKAKN